jgi:cytochrome P450
MPLPPGPSAPGALQSLHYGLDPYGFFGRAQRRYGDVFTVRVTGQTWVMLAHPDLVREALSHGPEDVDSGVANRPLKPLIGTRNVLLLDGDEHLERRRLVLPPLHGERMRAYGPAVVEAARRQFERWPRGHPVGVLGGMQTITLDVILRTVFGVEDAARLERLRASVRGVQGWLTGVRAALIFTYLGPDRLARMPAFRRQVAAVDADVYAQIARRLAEGHLEERTDVLSLLLQTGLSDRDVRDELVTLLVAGHETTAALLAWAVHELARDPAAQERLAAGEEGWAEAVVTETLRLHPPVPLVVRRLRRALRFGGHELPEGTTVAPCAAVVHRRPDVWPEPDAFRPQRFAAGGRVVPVRRQRPALRRRGVRAVRGADRPRGARAGVRGAAGGTAPGVGGPARDRARARPRRPGRADAAVSSSAASLTLLRPCPRSDPPSAAGSAVPSTAWRRGRTGRS